jgi:hypothetical protein
VNVGYAGVELAKDRPAQLLDCLVLVRVREFGNVVKSHRSLGEGVLVIEGMREIVRVVVSIVGHCASAGVGW